MSKACAFCIFIPGTYIIHYIHNRHWCGCIPVYNYPKTICKSKFFKQYHNTSRVFQNKFVKVIEKLRKVIENIQVEKCSECWYEFNGWVRREVLFHSVAGRRLRRQKILFILNSNCIKSPCRLTIILIFSPGTWSACLYC